MLRNPTRLVLTAVGTAIALLHMVAVGACQPVDESATSLQRTDEPRYTMPPSLDEYTFSHTDLDTVLARHVKDGWVDYAGLAADREHLDRYLEHVAAAVPELWSHEEQFAFWVNVYNARVLAHVIDRPGLKSVLDVGKIIGVPTLGFFRQKRTTAGAELSLSQIEHHILRASFEDPRLHFVLNCASASCPNLPPRALTAATLEAELRDATAQFLTDSTRNHIQPPGTMDVSEIFKWYRKDFEAASGSVQSFIEAHWPGEGEFEPDLTIRHLKYDWKLNGSW